MYALFATNLLLCISFSITVLHLHFITNECSIKCTIFYVKVISLCTKLEKKGAFLLEGLSL